MYKKLSERKRFSIVARGRSFKHAFRGVGIIFRTQHNAWVHGLVALVVILMGLGFDISVEEWAVVILSITSVLAAEAFNTAVKDLAKAGTLTPLGILPVSEDIPQFQQFINNDVKRSAELLRGSGYKAE